MAGGVFWVLNRPTGGGVTIVVPSPTPIAPAISSTAAPTPEKRRTNINTASVKDLETLPGIGPVKAQAIVDYRNQSGPFRWVSELLNVPGIGPTTYQAVRDLVTVGEPP